MTVFANRNGMFYVELGNLTINYIDNSFQFTDSMRNLKIKTEGASLEFTTTGADGTKKDGLITVADGMVTFTNVDIGRIAVRKPSGTNTLVRIWAYN